MYRILVDIFLFILIFFLPWWLILVILFLLLFYFSEPPFLESIVFGFLLDLIYGGGTLHFPQSIIFTTTFFIAFVAVTLFKKRLRFY